MINNVDGAVRGRQIRNANWSPVDKEFGMRVVRGSVEFRNVDVKRMVGEAGG